MKPLTYDQVVGNFVKYHGLHSPDPCVNVPEVLIKALVDSINENLEPEQEWIESTKKGISQAIEEQLEKGNLRPLSDD